MWELALFIEAIRLLSHFVTSISPDAYRTNVSLMAVTDSEYKVPLPADRA